MEEKKLKADVVIAGAGIAGLVAACELIEHNFKVIILDRDEPKMLGGLARWSFGGMFFVNSPEQRRAGIRDSVDLALADWKSFAEFGADDQLPKAWAEKYVGECTDEVYRWLKARGVSFFPVVHWVERGLFKPGNSVPRFHMVWGTGYGLAMAVIKHLQNHPKSENVQILHRHRVTDLISESGRITGVNGVDEEDGTPFEALGEHVIVATGGINGSMQKVRANWHKDWGSPPEEILNGSHQYAIGDLHEASERRGANITHLDKMWNYAAGVHHPRPEIPNHGLSVVPPKSALWLNYQGRRFEPIPLITAYDTRYLVEQVCKQEKKYSWQVLNYKIAKKEFAVSGSEYNDAIRDKNLFGFLKAILFGNTKLVNHMIEDCIDFVSAGSIDELADKMNALAGSQDVDRRVLRQSIESYDNNILRGKKYHNDEQLRRIAHARQYRGDRVRTCKFQRIADPGAMPLIAIREFIVSRKSLGGIQTDLQCRVLSKGNQNGKQEVIPGLYAIGESAGFGGGGIHGLRALEGTFLGTCVLTGREAAKTIANKSS